MFPIEKPKRVVIILQDSISKHMLCHPLVNPIYRLPKLNEIPLQLSIQPLVMYLLHF